MEERTSRLQSPLLKNVTTKKSNSNATVLTLGGSIFLTFCLTKSNCVTNQAYVYQVNNACLRSPQHTVSKSTACEASTPFGSHFIPGCSRSHPLPGQRPEKSSKDGQTLGPLRPHPQGDPTEAPGSRLRPGLVRGPLDESALTLSLPFCNSEFQISKYVLKKIMAGTDFKKLAEIMGSQI